MSNVEVLRTTKIGNGFVKEDVMQYIDELNSKINRILEENERLKKGLFNPNNDEIKKYKNQVEKLRTLNEKLYEEKIEMEYRTEYLRSLLDKANAKLKENNPAEKTSGVTLHKIPEETNTDDDNFREEVIEKLCKIEERITFDDNFRKEVIERLYRIENELLQHQQYKD